MCKRWLVLIVLVLNILVVFGEFPRQKSKLRNFAKNQIASELSDMDDVFEDIEETADDISDIEAPQLIKMYTKWSLWSRCVNCYQRRMKKCDHRSCGDSRIYEEKPCERKRCQRRARQKERAHIVHLDETSNFLPKQAPVDIFSRWTPWSPCSIDCRTYRIRRCRKPGLCRKNLQEQKAYCYHTNSNCEEYVFSLLEQRRQNFQSQRRYHYYDNHTSDNEVGSNRRSTSNKNCGVPNRKFKMLKILGGVDSKKYKWPWHVAIMNKNREVFCGGTLIGSRWVLTASHCIRQFLRVRINAHNLQLKNNKNDITMTVFMMFPHPKFNMKTIENDIALLMLPKAVKTPIACLPARKPRPGQVCSVMGWGKVRNSDRYGTHILQEAKLPVVKYNTCKQSYSDTLTPNMLCAGWKSGKADTCAGDSGGGLMCPNKRTKYPSYSVQGITSFGDGCGKKQKYGIYTSVFNYVDWINKIMDHYG